MDTASATHASAAPVEPMERRLLMSHTAAPFATLIDGDFNGDGTAESLVRVSAGRVRLAGLGFSGAAFRRGSLLLLDGNGALFGDPLGIRARGRAAPLVVTGDFNADGRLDLIIGGRGVRGAAAGRGLTLLAGNGDGTFRAGVPIGEAPANVTSLTAADVNGDGRDDLIGTARVRRAASAFGRLERAVREESLDDRRTDNDGGVAVDLGPGDAGLSRPHLVGASAEAGGGVVGASALQPVGTGARHFLTHSPFADGALGGSIESLPSVPPGVTPPASRVGVTAEAGGAHLAVFGDLFFGPGPGAIDHGREQVFVLLGNGNGTFTRVYDVDLGDDDFGIIDGDPVID